MIKKAILIYFLSLIFAISLCAEKEETVKGKAEKITMSSLTVVIREKNIMRVIPMIIHERPEGIHEGDKVEVKYILKNKKRYLVDIKKIE